MSEEEKKAIEVLKSKRASEQLMISGKMCVDILLNLIEKQQKELNSLKEIEQAHKTDNGLLRQELDIQIEHNKELEEKLNDEKENLEFEIEELKGQIYDLGGEIE